MMKPYMKLFLEEEQKPGDEIDLQRLYESGGSLFEAPSVKEPDIHKNPSMKQTLTLAPYSIKGVFDSITNDFYFWGDGMNHNQVINRILNDDNDHDFLRIWINKSSGTFVYLSVGSKSDELESILLSNPFVQKLIKFVPLKFETQRYFSL